jgi:hypothetical protein
LAWWDGGKSDHFMLLAEHAKSCGTPILPKCEIRRATENRGRWPWKSLPSLGASADPDRALFHPLSRVSPSQAVSALRVTIPRARANERLAGGSRSRVPCHAQASDRSLCSRSCGCPLNRSRASAEPKQVQPANPDRISDLNLQGRRMSVHAKPERFSELRSFDSRNFGRRSYLGVTPAVQMVFRTVRFARSAHDGARSRA